MKYVKLSPPRVHAALARQRLFSLLENKSREHPVIWMCSPPGAGKTALAASYLAGRQPPAMWYQIDQDDADPQNLFFFLAQIIDDGGTALPVMTPDMASDVVHFSRRFFREFYARLAPRTVLVFDNLQDFDWQRSGEILEIAFREIPEELTIFALSRSDVPARLARLVLNGQISVLNWDDLRFTSDESRRLADFGDSVDSQSQEWLDKADGWAVGISLLREHRARNMKIPASSTLLDCRDSASRYFSGEILDRLESNVQQALMMLSSLPDVSADDANHLTGSPKIADMLRHLYQERYFVDRRGSGIQTYHFHPLFHEFLVAEARQRFHPDEHARLLHRAAVILDNRGNIDIAAKMYRDAGAFSALGSLLLRRAEDMLVAGRGKVWREWLEWLPPALVAADPWLWFWLGVSLIHDDPVGGHRALLQAEQAFNAVGDVKARLISIAAIIDSYYFGLANLSELLPWISAINEGLEQLESDVLDPAAELQIRSRLSIALLLVMPTSPALPANALRTVQLLALVSNPAARLSAGSILLHCKDFVDSDTTRWVVAELNSLVEQPGISVHTRCWWCIRAALWHVYLDGNLAESQRINDRGLQLVDGMQLHRLEFQLKFNKALILLAANELDAALPLLNKLKPLIAPSKKLDLARFLTLESHYCLQIGDIEKGIRAALESIALATQSGLPAIGSPRFDSFMAATYAQAKDFKAAEQWYEKAISHTVVGENPGFSDKRDLIQAMFLAGDGGQEQQVIRLLQAALSRHRQRGRTAFFVRFPVLASSVAALALDFDIEKDYVRSIIRRQRLTAPGPFSANWPWPVAVRTLGSLTLSLNGDLQAFSGKAQQRPLVLLKALLLAPESGQTQQVIADHLWPDVADARASLNVTIHRLRKLLGNDDAVIVAGGKLSINRSLVWSDVDALMHLCDHIQTLPEPATIRELNHSALSLLSLYRGPFSEGNDESWLLSGRNRCRNRFLEAATSLGMRLEKLNELPMANTLYQRALDVEPLAETMYRNLMRCAHMQNDPSAAFSAYRRCRETLSVILGKRPSAETEKLAMTIGLIESMP